MLLTELHCHTIYSKDSLTTLEKLLEVCECKGIDRIAITDHNTTAGAFHAQRLDPERVIIGEEIMTTKGELLAFFMKDEIPANLEPLETITRLREQGAFISVSHPFDRMRNGHWEEGDLKRIIPYVDAIETFNARCMWPGFNKDAQDFAQKHNITGTIGSDAHAAFEVGKATMLIPDFHDRDSFKEALVGAELRCSLSLPWVHFTSRYAVWRKKVTLDENI